ncbi:MAG: hypothetical protein ACPL25_01840 [Ignavibacteria bacterium]
MLDDFHLEKLEFDYFKIIKFHLLQDLNHILKGLNSRIATLNDWYDQFIKTARSGYQASDLETGAERIFHHFFAPIFKFPNSSPIGSDLMYQIPDAIIHIDVKTALITNPSDYKGKINVSSNQSSYRVDNKFSSNLPFYYHINGNEIPCLTYVIQIVHEHAKPNIKALILAAIPNGQLFGFYNKSIFRSGKSGVNKSKDFIFKYSDEPRFKIISEDSGRNIFRVELIYLSNDLQVEEITANKNIPVNQKF